MNVRVEPAKSRRSALLAATTRDEVDPVRDTNQDGVG